MSGANVFPFRPGQTDRPDHADALRLAEAILFASAEPVTAAALTARLPPGTDAERVLADLQRHYAGRGVNLVRVAGGWAFRTAGDLAPALAPAGSRPQKISRAAMEVLAIIAYHQPVTRAEIEDVRGVATSKGTLDALMEAGWVRLRGRRQTPGRPVAYGTSAGFLDHFGLASVGDLPGLDELKKLGLFEEEPGQGRSGLPRPMDTILPDEPETGAEPDLAFAPEVEE